MALNFNSSNSSWWYCEYFTGAEAEILKFVQALRSDRKNESADLLFPVIHEIRKQEVYNKIIIKNDHVELEIYFRAYDGAQRIIDALAADLAQINNVPYLLGNYFSEVVKKYRHELRLLRKIRLMIKLMEGPKDETK